MNELQFTKTENQMSNGDWAQINHKDVHIENEENERLMHRHTTNDDDRKQAEWLNRIYVQFFS